MQLRIPGPTPCPEEVLKAMARQMINHRGEEFARLIRKLTADLKQVFQTKNDVFILTGSGTGGMEAAIVNTLSPDEPVLVPVNGFFSERFAQIAHRYGADVRRLEFPWGAVVDPDAIRKALREKPEITAVVMVHNETSTGLTNPLSEIARVVKEFDKLLIVDGISSLGSLEFRTDEWGIDVAITASQKGWMAPPGVAMISFSPKAWEAYKKAQMPRFYWDLGEARNFLERGQTPWTPALPVFFALEASLELILNEGIANVWARHRRVGDKVRKEVKALGLSLFPDEAFASNTVTAVKSPDGLDTGKLLASLRQEGVVLAGGQGELRGKIFRIGHLGLVAESDIDEIMEKLKVALSRMGFAHG